MNKEGSKTCLEKICPLDGFQNAFYSRDWRWFLNKRFCD